MKKSLVALAALAATTAFAQSSVSLYGNIDQAVFRSSADAGWLLSSNSNAGSTSLWGITGTEDLGGGTKVSFDLKSEITLATGNAGAGTTGINGSSATTSLSNVDQVSGACATGTVISATAGKCVTASNTVSDWTVPMFNRGAWIGIANSGLGELKIGRQNDAWWETTTKFNNTGINSFGWGNATAGVSGTAATHLPGLSGGGAAIGDFGRTSSNPGMRGTGMAFFGGLSYATPVFNGFQFKVGSGVPKTGYTTQMETNNLRSYSLNYAQGPLTAAWATTTTNIGDEAGLKNTMIAAKYVMGQYTFTAAQNQTRLGSQVLTAVSGTGGAGKGHDADVRAFGVGYALNAKWNLDVGYTTTTDKTDTANKFTQTGVTAKYAFSKRTTWYAAMGKGKNEGQSNYGAIWGGAVDAPGKGLSQTVYMTGLKHTF